MQDMGNKYPQGHEQQVNPQREEEGLNRNVKTQVARGGPITSLPWLDN